MIVTIDGPAGAGKSSAAKLLAQRLGFEYLDTGAMYRAVSLAVLRARVDPSNEPAVAAVVASLTLEMPGGQVLLDGADVSGLIRTPEVTAASSAIAASPSVRSRLSELQRAIAAGRDMVCEGRDQGTVVFPDAGRKFYLIADETERARRRAAELAAKGSAVPLEDILQAQQQRDRRDAQRDLAPMVPAADAVILDSTGLTLDQVVARMEQDVRQCRTG